MRCLLIFLAVLTLSGCANPPAGCLQLTSEGWYCPGFIAWPPFATEQATTIRLRSNSMQLLTRIQSDDEGVRLVSISPFGQTLITATWQNGALTANFPPGVAEKFDPKLIPGLLELALAPAETVRTGLGGTLTLAESDMRRSITSPQGEQIVITWTGTLLPYDALRIEVPALGLVIDSHSISED